MNAVRSSYVLSLNLPPTHARIKAGQGRNLSRNNNVATESIHY